MAQDKTGTMADALERWAKSAHTRDLYQGATSLSETLQQAVAMLRACKGKEKPMRCAECDCENGGNECTWFIPDRGGAA